MYRLLIAINILIFAVLSFAQNPDSLQIMTAQGSPGDTVELDVEMFNSDIISGMNIGIAYDSTTFRAISVDTTYRTREFMQGSNVWAAMFNPEIHSIDAGQIRLIAYSGFVPPFASISPGSGPIIVMGFEISINAVDGIYPVEFYEITDSVTILTDGYIIVDNGVNDPPNVPSNPSPVNGETNVGITAQLSWISGDPDLSDTATYDIYFGETLVLVESDWPSTYYYPGILDSLTTYFWKIVAKDMEFETEGPIWNFTTGAINCFDYLPGDVNMFNGIWPPSVIGGDVTYLVNYFRGISSSQPCEIGGFWASADINGDCQIIGSDVIKLVNYFLGNSFIFFCPDYEPCWHTPGDLPDTEPSGWPNCEMSPVTGKVLPSGSGK